MALFRKIFYRKPPDGLLEISDRVFVFDCCFTTDVMEDDDYKSYIGGIVGQLRECFPDASFMVFNFGKGGAQQSLISDILSQFEITVMDYPRQYENCPLLPMEMIHHFLRSSENWLSLGKMNVLLMHCDNGGLQILVFMLAALLIYRKQYMGEKKTLDMIYKQAPFQLLQLLSPLNPLPSQLRYLQYVSRRNVSSQWPPLDRALTLDCVIIRLIPNMDGEGGCRPIFRIYGQDPFMAADRTTKVLFSMPKRSRAVRHFKQADCELVKIDINCHVQGDVVLECITLDADLDHEDMMFRVMFNTAFIRSNILMLNRDEIDILWDVKDRFPNDFTTEFLFSDMDSTSSLAGVDITSVEDREGLPIEAFAKIQEIFSCVDWLEPKTDTSLSKFEPEILDQEDIVPFLSARKENLENGFTPSEKNELLESALLRAAIEKKLKSGFIQRINEEKLEIASPHSAQNEKLISVSSSSTKDDEETRNIAEFENERKSSMTLATSKSSPDLKVIMKKSESPEVQVSVQRRRESNIISPQLSRNSYSNPASDFSSSQGSPLAISRFQSAPSKLGITELLLDPVAQPGTPRLSISTSLPSLSGQVSFSTETAVKASPPVLVPALRPPSPPSRVVLSTQSTPRSPSVQPLTPSQRELQSPRLQSTSQVSQTLSSLVSPLSPLQPSLVVPLPRPQSLPRPQPSLPPPRSYNLSPSYPSNAFSSDTKISVQSEPLASSSMSSSSSPSVPPLTPSQPKLQSPPPTPLPSTSQVSQILSSLVSPLSPLHPSPEVPLPRPQSLPPPPPSPPPLRSCNLSPSYPSNTFSSDNKISGESEPLASSSMSLSSSKVYPVSMPPSLKNLLPDPSLSSPRLPPRSPSIQKTTTPSASPYSISAAVTSPPLQNLSSISTLPSPRSPILGAAQRPFPRKQTLDGTLSPERSSSTPIYPLSHSPLSQTSVSPNFRHTSIVSPQPPPPPSSSSGATVQNSSSCFISLPPPLSRTSLSTAQDSFLLKAKDSAVPATRPLPPPPPPPPPPCSWPTAMSTISSAPSPSPPPPPCSGPATVTTLALAPPPPPPCSGPSTVSTIRSSAAAPPPPPCPCSGLIPDSTVRSLAAATPPPPPPPCSGRVADSTIRSSAAAPPPPPPPCSGQAAVSSIRSSAAAAAPPPPPPCSGQAPVYTIRSSAAPPPPSPPHARNQNGPTVPPPPAPSISGNAGNKGIPAPPCTKGRLPMHTDTKIQAQGRKTSLKPYHWLKLTRAIQGSIWADAQRPEEASKAPELDMSELESLFSANAPNSSHSSRKSSKLTAGLKSDKVHLIELRRAYNCEIMLTKVKVPMSDLTNSILNMDDSALDIDQVENLIKFCPTKEEMELLKNYNGDKENLGKCEQFFLELMKVPRVESKLRVFSFKIQFCLQVSELRNSLNIINSASEEVRNSVKLKRIMQTILTLGNALNHGTARGSAVGFRLDSLLKLTETRARNNKLTLMHYLCKVLAEKLPEVLDFQKDLVHLEAATKIQLKYLAEEMQAFSKGLEKVMQELTVSQNDGPVSEHFCKMLKDFLGYAESEVRSLASLYSGVGRNADALALYFGEDPARCPFEQVVSTLLNFVRMFLRSHEENCKQIELEKKKAQKEAENQKPNTTSSTKESQNKIIESSTDRTSEHLIETK